MATIDGFVALPDDSGNAGKLVRAKIRVVGAFNVYEHVYQLNDPINDDPARVLTGEAVVTDAGIVTHPAPSENTIGKVLSDDLLTIRRQLEMQQLASPKIPERLGLRSYGTMTGEPRLGFRN